MALDIGAVRSGGSRTLNLLNAVPQQSYPELEKLLQESMASAQDEQATKQALDSLLGNEADAYGITRDALNALLGKKSEEDKQKDKRDLWLQAAKEFGEGISNIRSTSQPFKGGNKVYGRK